MTLAAFALAEAPIAADASPSSLGAGSLAAFGGFGTQGVLEYRGERFWALETQVRFRARESDGDGMLGVTDKDPAEKVWYEFEFIDVLHGASIVSVEFGLTSDLIVLSQELVSNGESVHLVRVLVAGGSDPSLTYTIKPYCTCSDGTRRARTLKIRSRYL